MNFGKEFDASGLACPLPIVKTKKSLSDMAGGQVWRVVGKSPVRGAPSGVPSRLRSIRIQRP
jgi:TusA-related sulfurtransferase